MLLFGGGQRQGVEEAAAWPKQGAQRDAGSFFPFLLEEKLSGRFWWPPALLNVDHNWDRASYILHPAESNTAQKTSEGQWF